MKKFLKNHWTMILLLAIAIHMTIQWFDFWSGVLLTSVLFYWWNVFCNWFFYIKIKVDNGRD